MKRRVSRTGGDKIRHPRRYYTPETMAARATVTESGCWVWPGRLTPDGYGQCRYIGKSMLAHRLSYELHVGPIPAGLTIDHLCRNRCCVNPDHLELVTHKQNQRRRDRARSEALT